MSMFKKWKDRYERHWCTKDQLKRLVQLGVFTTEQYEEITGEEVEKKLMEVGYDIENE